MKLRIIYILLISLIITSCKEAEQSNSVVKPPKPDTTPQTTLMYMTGTDLSSYFRNNIAAAKSAIAKDELGYGRFLVFRHISHSSAELIEYRYENGVCMEDILAQYTDITSLSQESIVEVVSDVCELAPADRYNLIVSGHATGWIPKSRLTSTWSTLSADAETEIDWCEMFSSSGITTRYLGSKNDSFFDISELKKSLEATNVHFGYIIFDECFMSSIEALYDLRNLSDYIVASPCEIMGDGLPYATVIPHLFANHGLETDLQAVCQAYVEYYSTYAYPSGCIALTVTSELDELAAIIKRINSGNTLEVDIESLQAYERLASPLFLDLEQYTLAICEDNALSSDFVAQMALAFPPESRLHTERFFANIGISASTANNYYEYYTTIEYYSGVTTSAHAENFATEWSQTAWAKAINAE